jgi:hypothetical protein
MDRIECSVWNNGRGGWGLKVLGGPEVRTVSFNRGLGCVALVLDESEVWVNIDKKSFWNETCGELICKGIGEYVARHNLQPSARVWLKAIEPGARFAVELE